MNKRKSKIYFADISAHTDMIAQLREKGIHSSLVHHTTSAEDLKNDLDNLLPGIVHKAVTFATPSSVKKDFDTKHVMGEAK